MKHGVSLQLEPEMCVRSAHGFVCCLCKELDLYEGRGLKGGPKNEWPNRNTLPQLLLPPLLLSASAKQPPRRKVVAWRFIGNETMFCCCPDGCALKCPPPPVEKVRGKGVLQLQLQQTMQNAFCELAERCSMIFHRVRWRCECFMAIRPVLIP